MRNATLLLLLPALLGQAPKASDDSQAARARRERLLETYRGEAESYTVFRDADRKERAELRREPVYVWTNQVRNGNQDGAVFVWTCRGRAEMIATFFSYPQAGPRSLHHELHSLATTVLDVTHPGEHPWHPEAPGLDLAPIPGAPPPGPTASQRLAQMRELARDFTATSEDKMGTRWELRLLPRPVFRDESTDPDVLDGAVFAFVTSAGTDPEVILVLEARRPKGGKDHVWQYAVGRFSDLQLWVKHKGKEVFTCPDIPYGTEKQDPRYRYHSFRERTIPGAEGPTP